VAAIGLDFELTSGLTGRIVELLWLRACCEQRESRGGDAGIREIAELARQAQMRRRAR
jgi:hypothetical protein